MIRSHRSCRNGNKLGDLKQVYSSDPSWPSRSFRLSMYREGICGMKVSKRKLYWSPSCTIGTKSVMETSCRRKDISWFTVSESFGPTQQEGHSRAGNIIEVSVEEDDHRGPESRRV